MALVATVSKAQMLIQAALDTTTAHAGTRFILQVSNQINGEVRWF